MDSRALHLETRNALELADELSRHEHSIGNSSVTGNLRSLETSLAVVDRHLGRSDEHAIEMPLEIIETTRRSVEAIARRRGDLPLYLHGRFDILVASGRRIVFGLSNPYESVPAKPLVRELGLPVVFSQDTHSILGYVASGAAAASTLLARTSRARLAGSALALAQVANVGTSDTRLAVSQSVPVETHRQLDIAWGFASVLAPFVLGYVRKDPIASSLQILAGAANLVSSLFTEYRAEKGLTRPRRSRGGPEAGRHRIRTTEPRIPPQERPLEGLSSAPTLWTYDR